jgi:pimeloyl-ACP methyl ester carboxylesterase
MLQWALTLSGDGWRCVMVDLRGHGGSTGKHVFFGVRESLDLGQLANDLDRHGELPRPVAVLGASYGAALALKWAGEDARLERVIALTPYAELEPAVLAIRDGYARWIPRGWVQRAATRLPDVVGVGPGNLDPIRWLAERPVSALFIATDRDPIAPPEAVTRLHSAALSGSGYRHLTNGIHETAPFQFEELLPVVRNWLEASVPSP